MRLSSHNLAFAIALYPGLALAQAPDSQLLMNAIRLSRPADVRALLAQGADPNARDDFTGGNAISAAFVGPNGMALVGRLDQPEPARQATALEVLRALVEKKPALDLAFRIGPRDATPLMLAAEAGALAVMTVLLDGGANPNATNGGRYTALDYAADRPPIWSTFPASDRAEIVRLLLARGARTDRAGADGVRPAERARRAGRTDLVALIEAK